MSYKDKTYVIFDADNDMWAFGFMKGWRRNERIDFDFEDAHELKPLTYRATDEYYIKKRLRERFASTQQVILLVGEKTRYLYKYVRWELDLALELNLPIIVVNLNGVMSMDNQLCPPILREKNAIHISFNLKVIKYSLDEFPGFYKYRRDKTKFTNYYWNSEIYRNLGIL